MIYIILFSCSYLESKEDARTIVKKWLNQEITLLDSINTTSQDSLWQFMLKKEFKILTVRDTNICTECILKLYDWGKLIREIDTISQNTSFLFVVHAKDYDIVNSWIKKNKFSYPIFYDYTNKMNILNKFPKNPQYQTFLLDKDNKILLIGSPIGNHHIWNLYKQIIRKEPETFLKPPH